MKVYYHPASTTSRPIMLFANEEKANVEFQVVDLFKGEHYKDEYLGINPSRMVPVLEDGDFRLTESSAILKYLADKLGSPAYPRDLKEVNAGGYLIYDSTWPRPSLLKRDDITIIGVPLAKLCNESFEGVRSRILMKNISYVGVLAALLDIDLEKLKELLNETYASKASLVAARRSSCTRHSSATTFGRVPPAMTPAFSVTSGQRPLSSCRATTW